MSKKSKRQSASKGFRRPDLFGPPPILEGEDPKAYDEILDRVFGAVGPTDFIEEIWVRDLVDVDLDNVSMASGLSNARE